MIPTLASAGEHVPPADAVAEANRHREEQEAQHQHEGDMDVAQLLGRHDVVGGLEVERRHDDGDAGGDEPGRADEAVRRPLLGLDVGLGLAQRFGRDLVGGDDSRDRQARGVRAPELVGRARGRGSLSFAMAVSLGVSAAGRSLSRRCPPGGTVVARCAEAAISGGSDEGTGHGEGFMCIAPRRFSGSMPEC